MIGKVLLGVLAMVGLTWGQPTIDCVGTPGDTTGVQFQQCRTLNHVTYICPNALGCTVSADWRLATLVDFATQVKNRDADQMAFTQTGANAAATTVDAVLKHMVYADQFTGATVSDQIDNAITSLGGSGFLTIPAGMGAGAPASLPEDVTIFDFRGVAAEDSSGSVDWNVATASGQRARLRLTDTKASYGYSTSAVYLLEAVSGALPASETTATMTAQTVVKGVLTSVGAGQTIVGSENNVTFIATGGLTLGATTFPTEGTHFPVRANLSGVTLSAGDISFGTVAVNYVQNIVRGTSTGVVYNAFGNVFERQTLGTVSNYSAWSQGSMLLSNDTDFDGIDSAHAPQHILTLTATDYVMARPLADANGWTFRNQAGNVSWLDLNSAHTRVPISSRFLVGDDTEPVSGFAATYSVGGSSEVIFRDTTQTTGNKNWNVGNSLTEFIIRPSDDAGAATNNGLTIERNGNVTVAGYLGFGAALIALGGGAAPTLGTIGGTGPTVAAQNTWLKMLDNGGNSFWVPVWK